MLSNLPKVAFAVFVKTPGLSPVKTRLGATIGQKAAEEFYQLSVNKIKGDLLFLKQNSIDITADLYWAIAEDPSWQHDQAWTDFFKIYQGSGGLGQRLSKVYTELQSKGYDAVVFMGADAPQIGVTEYYKWTQLKVKEQEVYLGPTKDGGFYCFVANSKVDEKIWTDVSYSSATTTEELKSGLVKNGFTVNYLTPGFDVDQEVDFHELKSTLQNLVGDSSEEKSQLFHFLGSY